MYNEGESLLNILEEAQKSTLSSQKASDADGAAIALIGNASAHMSKERRKKILKELNNYISSTIGVEMFEEWRLV